MRAVVVFDVRSPTPANTDASAMALGDVVDQLGTPPAFADARAARPILARPFASASRSITQAVGARIEVFGCLVDEVRGRRVDRAGHVGADRAALVDRLTDHVHDAAERLGADGHAGLPLSSIFVAG